MTKNLIKLSLVIFIVPIICSCVFVGQAKADSLTVSCQTTPANSLSNPINVEQSVNFVSSVSGGDGNYTYDWFGACIGTDANCQNSFSSEGNYQAYVTVTSGTESQTGTCAAYVRRACTTHDHKACVGNNSYWFNSCNVQEEQFQACEGTCCDGACVPVVCSSNSQCGTNGLVGDPFCKDGNVYKRYKTYTCNNPGTVNATCTSALADQLQTTCAANQTCTNGACTTNPSDLTVSCSTTPNPANANQSVSFISSVSGGTGSYIYSWTGACTGSSSTCIDSFSSSGTQTATIHVTSGSQSDSSTCSVSVNQNCSPNSYKQCIGNSLYWYDSCGTQGSLYQYCQNGCYNNACQENSNITVQTNSATNIYSNQATLNGYLYKGNTNSSCNNYVWFQYGTSTSYGQETSHQSQSYTGNFNQTASNLYQGSTYHFRAAAQDCSGNTVYGQDMTIYSNNNGGNLILAKTVKNLSNSSVFSNSTYASPGDMLMFMITLQANGSDIQNVVVRDYLPANLIYNNQLIVACTASNNNYNNNNYNYCNGNYTNYTGNISSGVYLNTIYSGQTITITYQTQVASVTNFAYGSTTLNNSVSATSSNGNTPTASASVFVTRSAVYGASTISTGLTNYFWVDSFFLPLLVTLIGIWMWKSGLFFGIERWFQNKKKTKKAYSAEKELSERIAVIQSTEQLV